MTIVEIHTGTECPTCEENFTSEAGMKRHHLSKHNESIAGATIQCDWCGDKSSMDIHEARKYDNQFCDSDCRGKWHSENHPERLSEYVHITCHGCGEEFTVAPRKSRNSERSFCSDQCESTWRSKRMSNDSNPNWAGGRGTWVKTKSGGYWIPDVDYGEWKSAREERITVDDNKCTECNMTRSEHRDRYGQDIHVHHVVPIRRFDNPSEANDIDNLATVCASCHPTLENNN